MGLFSRKKTNSAASAMPGSPMGFVITSRRARETLGVIIDESVFSDLSGQSAWPFVSNMASATALYSARASWLDDDTDTDSALLVTSIMATYGAFVACKMAGLPDELRMLVGLGLHPDFCSEFQAKLGPGMPTADQLVADAEVAIVQGAGTPKGKAFFGEAARLMQVFWSTGHRQDAVEIGVHFRPMLTFAS